MKDITISGFQPTLMSIFYETSWLLGERVILFTNSACPSVNVLFIVLPYPILTLVIFYFIENQILMPNKSSKISVQCQKGQWYIEVFNPGNKMHWGGA